MDPSSVAWLERESARTKNATLAAEQTALFQGETLRGLLLSAWGWSVVGTIATLAGLILVVVVGGGRFLLPLANWRVNLRGPVPAPSATS